ncbi:MAG: hypothetical protein V7606_2132 [Burkholderiales bacterium]|jgi:hypothetical protein
MNKAFLLGAVLAFAMPVSYANENEVAVPVVQQIDPVIHIDSKQLDLDFGKDAYQISLTPVTKQDYKILGLNKQSTSTAYSTFVYCALRNVAVDRGFDYWLLLPSRSADAAYVGYVRTEAEAKYIAEKSINRLKIHSVHKAPASSNGCRQASLIR